MMLAEQVLSPGRLRVLDVTRFQPSDRVVAGNWSCTRCGTEHPMADSWALIFDTARGPRSMVLCSACAEEYRSTSR